MNEVEMMVSDLAKQMGVTFNDAKNFVLSLRAEMDNGLSLEEAMEAGKKKTQQVIDIVHSATQTAHGRRQIRKFVTDAFYPEAVA